MHTLLYLGNPSHGMLTPQVLLAGLLVAVRALCLLAEQCAVTLADRESESESADISDPPVPKPVIPVPNSVIFRRRYR